MALILNHVVASAFSYFRDRRKIAKSPGGPGGTGEDDGDEVTDSLLKLCAVIDWDSLSEAISDVTHDCLPNVTDTVIYLIESKTGNLQNKDRVSHAVHDLPKSGLARSVYDSRRRLVCSDLPSEDPLTGLLPSGVDAGSTQKQVVLSPVSHPESDRILCLLGVVCGTLSPVHQQNLTLLEKHIAVCIQRLLRTCQRQELSQSDGILRLCEDLHDKDAGILQLKVIRYLEEQTESQCCIILFLCEETGELFCQVLGNRVLDSKIIILPHSSLSQVITSRKSATLGDVPDCQAELSRRLGFEVKSMLCVPLMNRNSTEVDAIVFAFNKKDGKSFTVEDEEKIRYCYRYTSSVLASTLAFQKENQLKVETEALLQVAKNLFTHLGKYCSACLQALPTTLYERQDRPVRKASKDFGGVGGSHNDREEAGFPGKSFGHWLISKFSRSPRGEAGGSEGQVKSPSQQSDAVDKQEENNISSSSSEDFEDAADEASFIPQPSSSKLEGCSVVKLKGSEDTQRDAENRVDTDRQGIIVPCDSEEGQAALRRNDSVLDLDWTPSTLSIICLPQIPVVEPDEELSDNDVCVLLQEVMQEARNITHAERCSLFLVENDELVAKVFDGNVTENGEILGEVRIPINQGIAGLVATTGTILNIKDAYAHPLFYRGVDDTTGFRTRNILCFPIKDDTEKVIGIAELCNKINGSHFTTHDEEVALAFSVYCGISIVHSLLYKKVKDAQYRSKLSNELMMYHMQISQAEFEKLTTSRVPDPTTFQPDMDKFSCIPRSIAESDTTLAVISMFEDMGFIKRWRINKSSLVKFCLMVKRGYRDPPYHNWYHAFSVGHFCYLLYKNLNLLEMLTEMEVFALFVACLCHDLDHRGTNNTFQVQSRSVLAALYSSEGSVLERHHFAQALCILNTDGCNIFENLTSPEYQEVLDLMQDIILATDLAHHLRIITDLQKMAEEGYNKDDPKCHKLLICLLMTSCDLSDQTKSWKTIKKIAELIYQEFFSQGDLEKAMGNRPLEMMDREKACIPELQLSFLNHIAHPVFQLLGQIIPEAKPLDDAVIANKAMWTHVKTETQRRKLSSANSLDFFRLKLDSVEKGIEDLKNGQQENAEENDVNGGNQ